MSPWNPEEATPDPDGRPDVAIVPYVEALNTHGVETLQSCAGHVHEDGTKTDGHLWLGPDALTPDDARELADTDGLYGVCRRYARAECWEVTYPGMAVGEETLRWNMEPLFAVLEVPLP